MPNNKKFELQNQIVALQEKIKPYKDTYFDNETIINFLNVLQADGAFESQEKANELIKQYQTNSTTDVNNDDEYFGESNSYSDNLITYLERFSNFIGKQDELSAYICKLESDNTNILGEIEPLVIKKNALIDKLSRLK